MDWGTWLLIFFAFLIYINIFLIAILKPYFRKKKNIEAKYGIGGIILFIFQTAVLLGFLILWFLGQLD
ncbi:hypothetical protein H0R92_04345 [Treponema sp. OMZ 840]|uniref:hypothetical protein n=1 Tax=Treponema sp. OMZ 840 TaxID=244313 RepID=UPI003D8FE9BA